MGGAKMAKSAGNIARVTDLLEAGVSARALRHALISVHYRQALSYSDESLAASAATVERLDALFAALAAYEEAGPDDPTLDPALATIRAGFDDALDDDLNVSAALGALFDGVRELNRRIAARSLSTADARRARAFLIEIDAVLGLGPEPADEALQPDLAALFEARAAARAGGDWGTSDRLRDELADRGVLVEDTRDGQRWRRAVETTRA
jgi:cysteinyl-tRNA synthetase